MRERIALGSWSIAETKEEVVGNKKELEKRKRGGGELRYCSATLYGEVPSRVSDRCTLEKAGADSKQKKGTVSFLGPSGGHVVGEVKLGGAAET